MKTLIFEALLVALSLAIVVPSHAGVRPSTDEMAVRLAVRDWSRGRAASAGADLRITFSNGKAITTFTLRGGADEVPDERSFVTLAWEKRDAMWQLAHASAAALVSARQ